MVAIGYWVWIWRHGPYVPHGLKEISSCHGFRARDLRRHLALVIFRRTRECGFLQTRFSVLIDEQ